MRFRLRTLMIVLAIGPPTLALWTIQVAIPVYRYLWPQPTGQPVRKQIIFSPMPTGQPEDDLNIVLREGDFSSSVPQDHLGPSN